MRADRLFEHWRQSVVSGEPPVMYPVADASNSLSQIEIGPGLVTLIGGAPGAGKTAFVMQLVVDAMRITPTLRVLVSNVEMQPEVLLDRQLARISGIDLRTIRYRRFGDEHQVRLGQGMDAIERVSDRLAFMQPSFNMQRVNRLAKTFRADLVILDYIQRFASTEEQGDRRGRVDACMQSVRDLATDGKAVIVVSALSRTKNSKGQSSYTSTGLGMASFRDSSELEFGADDGYILAPSDSLEGLVVLKHLKSRHSMRIDHQLEFDGAVQSFTPVDDEGFADSSDDSADYEVTVSTEMPRLEWRD